MAFRVPTRLVLQPGCLARLPEVVASYAPRRILLVTDSGLAATGLPARVRATLEAHAFDVLSFDQVEPNPRHTTVDRLAAEGRGAGVTLVVGLGGGSVLDAAKAAAMLIPNGAADPGKRCEDFEGRDRYTVHPLPFIAIPTTCGTGSEVTWVAVITHRERLWKMSLKGETMFPDWALVDADLLRTLPGATVAWTGLDALTHALEAATGRAANPVSDALAARAVELLFRYLWRAASDVGGDGEAREGVMEASTLAGLAFGSADVAAVHCLSETLGARWDLPHGLLNAVLLAPVLRSHGASIVPRLAALEPVLAGSPIEATVEERAERLLASVEALARSLGTPGFRDLGIEPKDYPWIARRAAENGSNPSNPRPMGAPEYLSLLKSLS